MFWNRWRFRMNHGLGHAAAGLICGGQYIQALHHTEILMRNNVAMRDKAAHRNWIKMNSKGNRSKCLVIDVRRERTSWRDYAWHDDSIVPFRSGKGLAVYLGDQKRVLMNVKRMVAKRAIDDGPLFVVVRDHVVEQRLVRVKQPVFFKIGQRHIRIAIGYALVVVIPHHQQSFEGLASPIGCVILGEIPTATR